MLCKEEESIRFEPIKNDGLAQKIVSEIQFATSVSTKYLKRKIYPEIKSRLKNLTNPFSSLESAFYRMLISFFKINFFEKFYKV